MPPRTMHHKFHFGGAVISRGEGDFEDVQAGTDCIVARLYKVDMNVPSMPTVTIR